MASSAHATSLSKGKKRKFDFGDESETRAVTQKAPRHSSWAVSVHGAYSTATMCLANFWKSVTMLGLWSYQQAKEVMPLNTAAQTVGSWGVGNSSAAETNPLFQQSKLSSSSEPPPSSIVFQSGGDLASRAGQSRFGSARRAQPGRVTLQQLRSARTPSKLQSSKSPSLKPHDRDAGWLASTVAQESASADLRGQSSSVQNSEQERVGRSLTTAQARLQLPASVRAWSKMTDDGPEAAIDARAYIRTANHKARAAVHSSCAPEAGGQQPAASSLQSPWAEQPSQEETEILSDLDVQSVAPRQHLPEGQVPASCIKKQRQVAGERAASIAEEMYTSPSASSVLSRDTGAVETDRGGSLVSTNLMKGTEAEKSSWAIPSKLGSASTSAAAGQSAAAQSPADRSGQLATPCRLEHAPETCNANLEILAAAASQEAQPVGPEPSWESWVEALEVIPPAAMQSRMIPCPRTDFGQDDTSFQATLTPHARTRRVCFDLPEKLSPRIDNGGTPNRQRRVPRLRDRDAGHRSPRVKSLQNSLLGPEPCQSEPATHRQDNRPTRDSGVQQSLSTACDMDSGCDPMDVDSMTPCLVEETSQLADQGNTTSRAQTDSQMLMGQRGSQNCSGNAAEGEPHSGLSLSRGLGDDSQRSSAPVSVSGPDDGCGQGSTAWQHVREGGFSWSNPLQSWPLNRSTLMRASRGAEEGGVGNVPSLPRRTAHQRPERGRRGYFCLSRAPERDNLEQAYRDAMLNEKLASSWEAGESWAATDFYGLEITPAQCARHKETYKKTLAQLILKKGEMFTKALTGRLEQEWAHLKGLRLKYTLSPAQVSEPGSRGRITPRSILKRKSALVLQQEATEAISETAVRILHRVTSNNLGAQDFADPWNPSPKRFSREADCYVQEEGATMSF